MKTVLITGTSRGIGKSLALKFLKEGFLVIGTSTSGKQEIKDKNFKSFKLDLSSEESINRFTREFFKLKIKIDILINNAGIWSNNDDDPIVKIKSLRKVLEVNLIGTINLTEQLIPAINLGGQIVNISSQAGSLGRKKRGTGHPDYNISKAALNMFTKMLSVRFGEKILVSSIHPGWVKTDMGGMDAELEPTEAAEDIFKRISTLKETGKFWYKQEEYTW